jgi:HEPN domain-containing protein
MITKEQLEQVAERYRGKGYRVIQNPTPDDLPSFAKDFKVEILATRPDGNVLASAKATATEFDKDKNLAHYADTIAMQQGWRYDVFVLGSQSASPISGDITDSSDDEIERTLASADHLLVAGFSPQALIVSWAALEAAMRQTLRALGEKTEWGTSPRSLINELLSSGIVTRSEFQEIEEFFSMRNAIAHGYSGQKVDPNSVRSLTSIARRLIEESKQPEPAA